MPEKVSVLHAASCHSEIHRRVDEFARERILYNMKSTRVSVAGARRDFAKVLARAAERGSRIKVTRYGTTLAGIISRSDLHLLEECDETPARRSAPRRRRSPARSRK
jgi:prevent-host-death family protein